MLSAVSAESIRFFLCGYGEIMRHVSISLSVAAVLVITSSLRAAAPIVAESNVEKRTVRGTVMQSERDEQEGLFNYYFAKRNLQYETKLSELKNEASVPSWRIPYSASIHPQSTGGMSDLERGGRGRRGQGGASGGSSPLSAYDRAFNGGKNEANAYEVARLLGTDRALFVARKMRRNNEAWEGYCSGFTAATVRHPEPVKAVDAGDVGGTPGVILQPSDIKALLTCIYNRTTDDSYLYLAPPSARDGGPNMGTFHLALANYIGRAGHAIGFDRTKGSAPWNNPVYAYEVKSIRDAGEGDHLHYKTVETTITYSFYGTDGGRQSDPETGDIRGNVKQTMNFRYNLALDDEGRIVGGTSLNYNGYFFWIPLYAPQAKADGSVQGNPHVDVRKVVALARASADPAIQKKFDEVNIGPMIDPSLDAAEGEAKADESAKPDAAAQPKEEPKPEPAAEAPKADETPAKPEEPAKAEPATP